MSKTLLLVDDEIYILQSLKRLLSKQGYQVLTATSGSQGLGLLKHHAIQVVICDQRMPLMSGSEFVKKVHDLYPKTVCMILSAYIDFEALKEAINDGAIYKFISKPWQDDIGLTYVQDAFVIYTKRAASKQTIGKLINHDALTGLPNRYFFYESLERQIVEARKTRSQFAIACLDINRFSKINALFGPKKADILLQRLAKRLKKFVWGEDYIARMGN